MSHLLDFKKVSSHFKQPPPPILPKSVRFYRKLHKSILNYDSIAPVSVSFCWVPGIGGEVALERFPALVVVLIQTVRGLEPPLGDSHT